MARAVACPSSVKAAAYPSANASEAPAQYARDVSARHAAFTAGSLIVSAGAFLLIPAMAGAMRLSPGRGGVLVTAGGLLASIAAASVGAGTLMLGAVIGMLTPSHAHLAMQVAQIGNHSSIGSPPFLLGPGLIAGLLLVGVSLYRARLAHRWPAVLLAISVVPVFAAPSGGARGALPHLPLSVAIAALGLELWRLSAADSHGSPALPHPEASPAQARPGEPPERISLRRPPGKPAPAGPVGSTTLGDQLANDRHRDN